MPNPLVSTEWLSRAPERPRHRRGRRLLVPAGDEPRPGGRVPSPATSRARCGSTSTPSRTSQSPAAHAAAPGGFRLGDVGALGIGDGMKIVVYDGAGLFSAPRVWWMFRTFGARDVVDPRRRLPGLEGGGPPVEEGPANARASRATSPPRLDHSAVADLSDVRRALETGAAQVVDMRAGRPLPRRGAGAAPGPALRAHARQPQPALRRP